MTDVIAPRCLAGAAARSRQAVALIGFFRSRGPLGRPKGLRYIGLKTASRMAAVTGRSQARSGRAPPGPTSNDRLRSTKGCQREVPRAGRPRETGPENRDGMPRLPVGQHEVKNWPVLDLGRNTRTSRSAEWRLEVDRSRRGIRLRSRGTISSRCPQVGRCERLSLASRPGAGTPTTGRGVRFRDHRGRRGRARRRRRALCCGTGYDADPDSGETLHDETCRSRCARGRKTMSCWFIHGKARPLPREHGGPCRMITPKLYAWKGAKMEFAGLSFSPATHKGFWGSPGLLEQRRSHGFNDRYSTE